MPISVKKKGKNWVVINTDTGKIHGTHPSAKEAYGQLYVMKKKGVDISGKKEKK